MIRKYAYYVFVLSDYVEQFFGIFSGKLLVCERTTTNIDFEIGISRSIKVRGNRRCGKGGVGLK